MGTFAFVRISLFSLSVFKQIMEWENIAKEEYIVINVRAYFMWSFKVNLCISIAAIEAIAISFFIFF